MGQQTGVQVDITRYTRGGANPSCGGVGPKLPKGPRKQPRASASLFALLSKPTAAQPPAEQQETPHPPNKKPRNALSAIFRRRRHATDELIAADGAPQQGNLAPPRQPQQLPGSSAPSADHEQRQRHGGQPACSMGTQLPATATADMLCQTGKHDTAQYWSPRTRRSPATASPQQQQQEGQHQQQARMQECPLCGTQLPEEQLQQHVDEELQDLEDLESSHQPVRQPQQQPLNTHLHLQQEQQTHSSHPSWQHPAGAGPVPPKQHLMQPVAEPQQMPLQPLQLPRLRTPKLQKRSRKSQQFVLQQQQARQQQVQQAYKSRQSGSTAGCSQHGSFQFPWEHPRDQQQQLQQLPQRQQWHSAPTQQRYTSQEQKMCQPPLTHQPVPSALYQQQQQQPSASKPLQLPKMRYSQKQENLQRQHSRKRSRGESSSSVFSSVTTLNMAPGRAVGDEPKSAVLDMFDHWGDTTINWLDDSMIGLEGAPQSAGECWEGIGRCAAGPRTLR